MTENKDIDYSKMKENKAGPNNQTSARVIVKLLVDAIHTTSVLDIGCGVGVWLNEFLKYPCVEKVQGIDGAWVLDWPLDIPRENIEIYNFEDASSHPKCINSDERFDLAICLEMAEHVSSHRAQFLVDALTKAADIIYFSGATPNSGGEHHVHERWQSYWINKFIAKGYQVVDYIRPKIWNNKEVAYFYAEESFLFIKTELILKYEKLYGYIQEPIFDCVHPEHFIYQVIKPSHDWEYLFDMQKRLLWSIIEKFRREKL